MVKNYRGIEEKIIEFASRHREVKGVSRGSDPVNEHRAYWLFVGKGNFSNSGLQNRIAQLGREFRDPKNYCEVCPAYKELMDIKKEKYYGELIWRR